MMKHKRWLFIIIMLPFLLTACLKDEDKTLILFGEEGYVKSVRDVFGMAGLPEVGIDTTGIEPPDVRGEFEFADRECIQPQGYPDPNDKVYFRFGGDFHHWNDYMHGQHHMITHCDVLIPGLDLNSERFHTDTAYVKGYGNRFIVYLEREQEVRAPYGNQVVRYMLSQGIAIAGNRAGGHENITDARLALYNKDINILNANEVGQEVVDAILSMKGMLFVYQDSDHVTRYNSNGSQPFINWDE